MLYLSWRSVSDQEVRSSSKLHLRIMEMARHEEVRHEPSADGARDFVRHGPWEHLPSVNASRSESFLCLSLSIYPSLISFAVGHSPRKRHSPPVRQKLPTILSDFPFRKGLESLRFVFSCLWFRLVRRLKRVRRDRERRKAITDQWMMRYAINYRPLLSFDKREPHESAIFFVL